MRPHHESIKQLSQNGRYPRKGRKLLCNPIWWEPAPKKQGKFGLTLQCWCTKISAHIIMFLHARLDAWASEYVKALRELAEEEHKAALKLRCRSFDLGNPPRFLVRLHRHKRHLACLRQEIELIEQAINDGAHGEDVSDPCIYLKHAIQTGSAIITGARYVSPVQSYVYHCWRATTGSIASVLSVNMVFNVFCTAVIRRPLRCSTQCGPRLSVACCGLSKIIFNSDLWARVWPVREKYPQALIGVNMGPRPKLKTAPPVYDKTRPRPYSSKQTKTTSRSVHISVPASQQAAPRKQTSYVSVDDTLPQASSSSLPPAGGSGNTQEPFSEPSDDYYIQEGDARQRKRQKTKVRIRRVCISHILFFSWFSHLFSASWFSFFIFTVYSDRSSL